MNELNTLLDALAPVMPERVATARAELERLQQDCRTWQDVRKTAEAEVAEAGRRAKSLENEVASLKAELANERVAAEKKVAEVRRECGEAGAAPVAGHQSLVDQLRAVARAAHTAGTGVYFYTDGTFGACGKMYGTPEELSVALGVPVSAWSVEPKPVPPPASALAALAAAKMAISPPPIAPPAAPVDRVWEKASEPALPPRPQPELPRPQFDLSDVENELTAFARGYGNPPRMEIAELLRSLWRITAKKLRP